MDILTTNLESAARENFRRFPQCYPVQTTLHPQTEEEEDAFVFNQDEAIFLTDEAEENLNLLADSLGEKDGYYEAGMTVKEVRKTVLYEFKRWVQ